jgi:guanosine-3',5'-bis(diphosphate) 3'-pyrophosphohydrolase
MRASGEPYIIHPLEVAEVLAEMKMDSTAIAAGLLHDSVEDTPATNEEIEAGFGEQVAHIVEGVTKIDKIEFANREDRQAENVRKMLLAMVSDVRVVLIKLADRLHNMRTLEHLSRSARRPSPAKPWTFTRRWLTGWAWARCAANSRIWPSATPIRSATRRSRRPSKAGASEGEQFLRGVEDTWSSNCARTASRPASSGASSGSTPSSEDRALQSFSFDQVYDLLAIRVITQDVAACYAVFGLIHTLWRPVPGRIKDFIAIPRANRYQSLHTTVMGASGHQFEVQIRTEEMHRIAEEGIAAHWKYNPAESR